MSAHDCQSVFGSKAWSRQTTYSDLQSALTTALDILRGDTSMSIPSSSHYTRISGSFCGRHHLRHETVSLSLSWDTLFVCSLCLRRDGFATNGCWRWMKWLELTDFEPQVGHQCWSSTLSMAATCNSHRRHCLCTSRPGMARFCICFPRWNPGPRNESQGRCR